MNILLINTNPVVSRLIDLCLRDEKSVLEEISDITLAEQKKYDIVFVDDLSYREEVETALENLMVKSRVYLSSDNEVANKLENFDEVIKKPFLPSQITTVIERVKQMDEIFVDMLDNEVEKLDEEGATTPFIFPLSADKIENEPLEEEDTKVDVEEILEEESEVELEPSREAEVLDSKEIERIKALLNDDDNEIDLLSVDEDYESRKVEVITEHLEADGLEIISEDEIVDILSNKSVEEKLSKKRMKKEKSEKNSKKKKEKKSDETYSFEETLIAAIEGMKLKKIKKLLKDKKVDITITLKDKK